MMTLTERLLKSLEIERTSMADVIRLLSEVQRTRHFAAEGYSSMVGYCMEALRMSKGSAWKRLCAAKLSERFPVIFDLLQSGDVHLSHLVVLSPHLTEANHRELLEEAKTKSEDALKRSIAERYPSKRKPKAKLDWLNGQEAELSVVLSAEAVALLERLQQLRKHKYPDGNASALLEEALRAYVKQIDPMLKKAPRTRKARLPQVHPRKTRRRVEHAVWHRDQAQCTFVAGNGQRCTEKGGLEVDHRQTWADGGSSLDPDNLRLLCFTHNRYLAELRYGKRRRV